MAMLHVRGGTEESPQYLAAVTITVATAMRYGYRPSLLLALVFCTFDALEERKTFGHACVEKTAVADRVECDLHCLAVRSEHDLAGKRHCAPFVFPTDHRVLASQAPLANTELQERLRESIDLNEALRQLSVKVMQVQEEEQRRLSLELHDDPLQRAVLLARDLGSALEQTARTQRGQEAAEEIAMVLRVVCTGVRPRMLDDLGLVPSLESLANTVRARSDLAVMLRMQAPIREAFGRLAPMEVRERQAPMPR